MGRVSNPMVLLVAIGDYEQNEHYEDDEIEGFLPDLKGIEHDVVNMTDLFKNRLHYDVYPETDSKEDEDGQVLIKWTEAQLKAFLEDRAKFLCDNINAGKRYDSLVVIISCHGIPQYLMMSNYKKYSKIAVHRTFSYYAELRNIPRLILFDCCAGSNYKEKKSEEEEEKTKDAANVSN